MSGLALGLLLAGCARHEPPGAPPVIVAPAPPPPAAPAGTVERGVFVDARYGFQLPVPPRWRAQPGLAGSALRVGLTGPNARVEVWAFDQGPLQPRPHEGCTWTYTDTGPYRALPSIADVLTATCTPEDPGEPHLYGYLFARPEAVFEVLVYAAPTSLASAKEEGDGAASGLHW